VPHVRPSNAKFVDVVALLNSHGDTVQRSPNLAPGESRIGSLCTLSRALTILPNDGVELRIEPVDACEEMLKHLAGA
jgi:hypothetical protein